MQRGGEEGAELLCTSSLVYNSEVNAAETVLENDRGLMILAKNSKITFKRPEDALKMEQKWSGTLIPLPKLERNVISLRKLKVFHFIFKHFTSAHLNLFQKSPLMAQRLFPGENTALHLHLHGWRGVVRTAASCLASC